MGGLHTFLGKVRREETPFYASLYRLAKALRQSSLPVPNVLRPLFRGLYFLHFAIRGAFWQLLIFFYIGPVLRARFDSIGKNLEASPHLPDIADNLQFIAGDNLRINGFFGASSSRMFEKPRLQFGNNVHIGHMVAFVVNKEIVVEDGVMIANRCYFADTDSHPTDPELRTKGAPPSPEDVKPVRICKNAWIGHAAHVLKGVTVGEGAVVAAGSVVVKDVPPFSVVGGNPAKVIVENILAREPQP